MTIDARDFLDSVAGYANSSNTGQKSSANRPVKLGSIDVNYTSGTPKVLFDGESTISDRGYSWVGSYTPVNGERVFLIPVGQSYIIGGKLESKLPYSRYVQLPLESGWVNYDAGSYHAGSFTKTETGLVKLSGLVMGGAVSQGTSIGRLPEGFRPSYAVVVPVMSNSVYGSVLILPDGYISCKGYSANQWLSLDNIVFPTEKLTWNSVTLLNSFTAPTTEQYLGSPQWAVDAQQRVWFRGAVSRTAVPAPDTVMFNIGAAARPPQQLHLPVTSLGNWQKSSALIGVQSNGDVVWKNDTASMNLISFASVMYSGPGLGGWTNATYQNGWSSYLASSFPAAQYRQDADGTVHIRGLIGNGPNGTVVFNLPAGMRPGKILLRVNQSSNVTGRIDIHGNGNLVAATSTAGWVTLDGISFTPEM